MEGFGLVDAVLAHRGVHDQPNLARLARLGFADGPFDLFELLHQVVLGVEPSGGVDEEKVVAPGLSGLGGVVGEGGGVGPFRRLDHGDAQAVAPDLELGAAGGPEGVAGGEEHPFPSALVVLTELGDGGGFPHPVDADHEDDVAFGGYELLCGVGLKPQLAQLPPALVGFQLQHDRQLDRFLEVFLR